MTTWAPWEYSANHSQVVTGVEELHLKAKVFLSALPGAASPRATDEPWRSGKALL